MGPTIAEAAAREWSDNAGVMATLLDDSALAPLHGRSLLLTQDWPAGDLGALLALAARFEALDRSGKRAALLESQLAYALFFDNSTRTKSAWAGASARLGLQPVIVDGSSTQVAHGETAEETGAMLGMNAHALGIRHDLILGEGNRFMREVKAGIDAYLKATGDPRVVPVVNLQCDVDHPTQTLADLLWLRERLGDLAGKRIAVSWAYSPSYAKPLSVPQGLITLLTRFGAHVTLAQPEGYRLMEEPMAAAVANAAASGGSFRAVASMDEAFEGAHAVYPKSWGPWDLMQERVAANRAGDKAAMADIEKRALERNARHRGWICDERRMGLTKDALYLHCLPADIGAEVSPGVMERFRVDVARQANKKVYVIMALLAAAKVKDLAARLSGLGE
jgi:knotted carbamoyltransferase YgeW